MNESSTVYKNQHAEIYKPFLAFKLSDVVYIMLIKKLLAF